MVLATVCSGQIFISEPDFTLHFSGRMYTILASTQLISGGLTMLVWWKGAQWRQESEHREAELAKRLDSATVSTKS